MFRTSLAAALTLILYTTSAGVDATSQPTGLWTGHGRAVRTAQLDLVTIAITYTSQFSFVVTPDGGVKGDALVTYELACNDAKLRAFLAQANAAGSAPLRTIPQVGALLDLGMSSRDVIGLRMGYHEGTPVRKAAITGSIANGRISLRWSSPPEPIPYQKYALYPQKERPMTPATHPAYTPWLGDATITEPWPGHLLATAAGGSSHVRRGDAVFVTTWTAERRGTGTPDAARRPNAGRGLW